MPVDDVPTQDPSRRRSFRRGLRQRNPLVLAGAAMVCLLVVLGVQQFFFGGGLTGVSQGRLLRITHDDYVHVAYRVNQLKKHPPTGQAIYIFGGSGAMETVVGERSFAAEIARGAGEPVTVVSLANHAQTLAQNLMIVDNLPRGRAVVLIGLAPMRLNGPPSADVGLLTSRPLLLRSARLARLAPALFGERAPFIGGLPGAFDFISAYLRQRIKSGPFPGVALRYDRHYYGRDATAATPLAKRLTLRSVWRFNRINYAANHEYNFTVLRRLLALAQGEGLPASALRPAAEHHRRRRLGGCAAQIPRAGGAYRGAVRRALPTRAARSVAARQRLRRPVSPDAAGACPLADADGARGGDAAAIGGGAVALSVSVLGALRITLTAAGRDRPPGAIGRRPTAARPAGAPSAARPPGPQERRPRR